MRGENWEEIQEKPGSGRMEMAGNFSVIVDSHHWNRLKDDDELKMGEKSFETFFKSE